MALTKGKYQPLHVDIEKSDYRELFLFVTEHGWTLAFFVRQAIENEIQRVKNLETPSRSIDTNRSFERSKR